MESSKISNQRYGVNFEFFFIVNFKITSPVQALRACPRLALRGWLLTVNIAGYPQVWRLRRPPCLVSSQRYQSLTVNIAGYPQVWRLRRPPAWYPAKGVNFNASCLTVGFYARRVASGLRFGTAGSAITCALHLIPLKKLRTPNSILIIANR